MESISAWDDESGSGAGTANSHLAGAKREHWLGSNRLLSSPPKGKYVSIVLAIGFPIWPGTPAPCHEVCRHAAKS